MIIDARGSILFRIGIFLATFALAALLSCGGNGTAVSGGGIGGTGKSIGAITARGSITVNGVAFETLGATITLDDTPPFAGDGIDAGLKIGMSAKVSGEFERGGTSGTADTVEVDDEVQGTITAFGPEAEAFTVLAQKIFVDGNTVYANVTDLTELQTIFNNNPTDPPAVEIHGQRDGTENIRATRVELLTGLRLSEEDELRGTVRNLGISGPLTFQIGNQFVTAAGANIEPGGASTSDIQNGTVVEVHGNIIGSGPFGPVFVAIRVDIEDLEDAAFAPDVNDEFEVEGFVTGFVDLATDFFVAGVPIRLAADVRFEGGVAADLANDVKVEAEGQIISGGILLADKIAFKDAIRIESNPTVITATSVTILGKTVLITSLTDTGNYTGDISAGLKVRGFLNSDGTTITATRLDDTSPVAADRHIYQALATGAAPPMLTLAGGIMVNTTGAEFRDDDETVLSSGAFFGLVTPGRTVVKARGGFSAGTIFANPDLRVEIE